MRPGPKKRVYERICVSLGKGQKNGLENLAEREEVSIADLVRRAVDQTYGKLNRSKKTSR